MLGDDERKVLRVLWSLYREAWGQPDMARICRLSGRNEKLVRSALKWLRDNGYIEVRPGELRVIMDREPEPPRPNTDYSRYTG